MAGRTQPHFISSEYQYAPKLAGTWNTGTTTKKYMQSVIDHSIHSPERLPGGQGTVRLLEADARALRPWNPTFLTYSPPVKKIEYGVGGDLVRIYPKPYSICLRATIHCPESLAALTPQCPQTHTLNPKP